MKDTKNKNSKSSSQIWGGHYAKSPTQIMQEVNQSIRFDYILYNEDIDGSIAHCNMLAKQNIITEAECKLICDGLEDIRTEINSGKFKFRIELEDIHMNIEARLREIIGDAAGKLHTARSRNDQIATDLRLWLKKRCDEIDDLLLQLIKSLLEQAKGNINTIMPGFTHLQTAQPVSFAHHMLAYIEMFLRDRERIQDCKKRINISPLGSAALAGTPFNIDRDFTAQQLDFAAVSRNSLDAVSDRDFAVEYLATIAICAMHLSRLAEEMIIWCSRQFQFAELPEEFTTGSSIMPQKRNPDGAELIRGKTGRIYGSLNSLLVTLKSLPLAYNKDMQEDKEPVFDATNQITACLKLMAAMTENMMAKPKNMRAACESGFPTATDLADWLVTNLNIPFREAHHITGKIVNIAEERNCALSDVPLEDMQKIESGINENIYQALSLDNSFCSRNSYGGTAPECVSDMISFYEQHILAQ